MELLQAVNHASVELWERFVHIYKHWLNFPRPITFLSTLFYSDLTEMRQVQQIWSTNEEQEQQCSICKSICLFLFLCLCARVCACVCVHIRLLCNLLSQYYQCNLRSNSINMNALQRDTHSVVEVNILQTNHHLWLQQQTRMQRCLTVVDMMLHINTSGGQFKWFTEGSLSQMS